MTAAVVVGIFLAVCTYFACSWFADYISVLNYTSEEAVERNINRAFADLEDYIEEKHAKATDTEILRKWAEDQEYTYLYIWDENAVVLDVGWAVGTDAETETSDSVVYESVPIGSGKRIDRELFKENLQNRIIKFEDGEYYVYIDVYRQEHWFEVMDIVSLSLSFLVLLFSLLFYHSRVVNRITSLAAEVGRVRDGDLDYHIVGSRNDEISLLAESVDDMRNAILQKHRSEKEAWEANSQLITSMSHDIRTPLTSMIGYLDIIEGRKYEDQEALDRYISSCREKAFQLKDLSDKLFQYFLVFGNKQNVQDLELMDANILFQQLLSEHCAEIISYGYKVEFFYNIPEVSVRIDISGLQRLFDNIFSNIMKYADKREVVCIYAETEGDFVKILAINGMPEEVKKVESTRIGLKTCEKICSDLGGEFSYDEQDRMFTVRVLIPVAEVTEEELQAETTGAADESEEIISEDMSEDKQESGAPGSEPDDGNTAGSETNTERKSGVAADDERGFGFGSGDGNTADSETNAERRAVFETDDEKIFAASSIERTQERHCSAAAASSFGEYKEKTTVHTVSEKEQESGNR